MPALPVLIIRGLLNAYDWENESIQKEMGTFFIEPYTNEEIDNIIKTCKAKNKKSTSFKNKNAVLGRRPFLIYDRFEKEGIFDNIKKTKSYAFIYDWCVIMGYAPNNEEYTTNEKYHIIKDWIKAYKKAVEKNTPKKNTINQ